MKLVPLPQLDRPRSALQTQLPPVHVEVAASHLIPQVPQLLMSVVRSLQPPLNIQNCCVDGHAHAPLVQILPPVHWVPHVPQLLGSVLVSRQDVPHNVFPERMH
jgi:hypothetical protein